jgi:Peptidase family M28
LARWAGALLNRWERLAGFVVVVAIWLALAWLGRIAYSPPSPRPADIPDNEFSAERARVILKELVGRGIPHPTRSQENTLVRERVLNYLRSVGYDPEVEVTHTLPPQEILASRPVAWNIVARRPGREPGRAILLAAHYDSATYAPGASDDGAGLAAILEIARMFRALPPTRNDVIFLLTDGEEIGLVGAHGFVREHPRAKEVAVAINLEARGTSGASLMFETSDDDAWLMSLFSQRVSRPACSSLFTSFYRVFRLGDTDFSVFKQTGMAGYNFAFIRDAKNYHTPNDDFAHADPGSLQHHGDNAWQLLTALADVDLDRRTPGRSIYSDVLGQFVLRWPASINFGLSLVVLTATLATSLIARWRGLVPRFRWRALLAVPLPLIAGAPFVFYAPVGGTWIDNPLPTLAVYWIVPLLVVISICRYTPLGRMDLWSAWTAVWLVWNAIGLIPAWFLPGASYLFLVPAVIAVSSGIVAALLPARIGPRRLRDACCLGSIGAGLLWLPLQVLLYDSLSFQFTPVYAISAGLVIMTALPLLSTGSDSAAP